MNPRPGSLSHLCLARASDVGPQRHQLLADRTRGGALDLAVARDERQAEWREYRAAAVLPPVCRSTAACPQMRLISSTRFQARLYDISIARPAAEIEPLALMYSSS
jgi:hypothetical protein